MYTTIIHKFQIKIYLLILIFRTGAFSTIIDTSQIVQHCRGTYPYKVSFRRIQSYRSVVLNAAGKVEFNRDAKIVVTYNKPFKYSVNYSDSATVTISKDTKTHTNSGFRDALEYDPFQALMLLYSARKQNLQYIGVFDSIRIYEGHIYGKQCRFSIDRLTQQVQDIAYITTSGAVYERMLYYYKKDHQMPSSVVVLKSIGGELVKDSLVFF